MTDIYQELFKAIKKHSGMDKEQIIDAGNHGADGGFPGFTYNKDCVEFYEDNKELVNNLARDMAEQLGNKNMYEMVSQFNRADMLDCDDGLAVLLAWFTLEEVGRYYADKREG